MKRAKLEVIMGVGPRDVDLALKTLAWSKELGHQDLVLSFSLSDEIPLAELRALVLLGLGGFRCGDMVKVREFPEGSGWPVGPNTLFLEAAHLITRSAS